MDVMEECLKTVTKVQEAMHIMSRETFIIGGTDSDLFYEITRAMEKRGVKVSVGWVASLQYKSAEELAGARWKNMQALISVVMDDESRAAVLGTLKERREVFEKLRTGG